MLGLVLLYFIGKKFYTLAEEYDKSIWSYAVLGIVIYYIGLYGAAFIVGIVFAMMESTFLENMNDFVLGLMLMPFGLLSCYLLYLFLEKKWKKEKPKRQEKLIDEIGRGSNF